MASTEEEVHVSLLRVGVVDPTGTAQEHQRDGPCSQ